MNGLPRAILENRPHGRSLLGGRDRRTRGRRIGEEESRCGTRSPASGNSSRGAATRRFPGVSVSRETGLSEFPFALDSLQGGTVLEAIARVMAGCAIAIKGG